mgnify:CR=1 FL=1
MTSQPDKAKRLQFSLRWLFFVTTAVASGAWSWLLLYRPASDAPLSWWDLKRPVSTEIFNCSLIGASVFGALLICNMLAKRWRLRFSVRTLVIVVTLLCCYLGAWEATKTWGIPAIQVSAYQASQLTSPCPFVIVDPEDSFKTIAASLSDNWDAAGEDREVYFWFFGYVAKLPYERVLEMIPTVPLDSPRGTSKQVIP